MRQFCNKINNTEMITCFIMIYIFSGPISVWNNNNELLPYSVINSYRYFLNDELPFLSLRCFSIDGHQNIYWGTRNVSTLPNIITHDTELDDLTVIEGDQDTTLNYEDFNNEKTGYYSCVSGVSGEEFTVLTTFGKYNTHMDSSVVLVNFYYINCNNYNYFK